MKKAIKTVYVLFALFLIVMAFFGCTSQPPAPSETSGIYGTLKITTGLDNNMWFTESQSNKIGKISPQSGAVTEYNIPTPNASAYAIAAGLDGNMWFTESGINKIGKISPQSGEITEYNIPTENASPDAIALGLDNNLWFTESKSNNIGKISPSTGVITEYPFGN